MKQIIAILMGLGLFAAPALAAAQVEVEAQLRAQVTASTTTARKAERLGERLEKAKDRADKEIDRRIAHLNKLYARVGDMKRLSDSNQATLQASVAAQIKALGDLRIKIDAGTATSSLRADIESIHKSYRIYALIMPQASLMAAADRALSVADQMNALATKLDARIAATTTATTTVNLAATLADMKAKIADAKLQANAAITLVSALKPDNGDKTIMEANLAALKEAREKVRAAQKSLQAARLDAGIIIRALGGKEKKSS